MTTLRDAGAVTAWLEDEGGLFDDARLISSTRGTLTFDALLSVTKSHDRGVRFSLRGAPLHQPPQADALSAVGVRNTKKGVELLLRFDDERVVLCAKSWTAKVIERWKRKRSKSMDPSQLSVTLKSLTVAQVVRGAKRHGVDVEAFANWLGSGNDLGSAFLDARTPRPARGALDGAWKVVTKGQKPGARSGVWLTGHDFSYESKQTLERTDASAAPLVRALASTFAALGPLSSGNVSVDDVETWLSSR